MHHITLVQIMHIDVWGINKSSMDSLHHIHDIYSIFELKNNVIEFSQNLQIKEIHALFHVFSCHLTLG